MPKLTIDGKEIIVDAGTTILEAAKKLKIRIPHFCYHSALTKPANCRICVVEVKGSLKLLTSCSTPVQDGMEVLTKSEKVIEAREDVMEFLLINHPLDCPICDQAGECKLQDYSFLYGLGHSRFKEKKRDKSKKDFGEHIVLYTNRCILCTRCVRFLNEIAGVEELGIFERGGNVEIDVFPGKKIESKFAGNIVDLCPVGALIDKDFLHKTRVWNLASYNSICPLCSKGCNIRIDVKDNRIQRIKPRVNEFVNAHWICDFGRYDYHEFDKIKRIEYPMIRESVGLRQVGWKKSIESVNINMNSIANEFRSTSVAGIGNACASNEENFLLHSYVNSCLKSDNVFLYHVNSNEHTETFKSGFCIEKDKNPNLKGAILCLNLKDRDGSFNVLLDRIDKKEIKAVYFLHTNINDRFELETIKILQKLEFLVVQSVCESKLTEIADIVLPTTLFYESDGTYVNSSGRIQQFFKSINEPGLVKEGWSILNELLNQCNVKTDVVSVSDIFNMLVKEKSELKDLNYSKLGDKGVNII